MVGWDRKVVPLVRGREDFAANWQNLGPVFGWTAKVKVQQVMHCGTVVQLLW